MIVNNPKMEIFRLVDSQSNKLWGRFVTDTGTWIVFWCAWLGSSSFKTHGAGFAGERSSAKTRDAKMRKGYKKITLDEISSSWPEFDTMMQERFTWYQLLQCLEI
jgi:hypothetical protein